LCLSLSSSWSSSCNARAEGLSSVTHIQIMSLCVGLLTIAGGLIALFCNSCMVSRLFFICDIESALSLLAEAVILLGCACGVHVCLDVSCMIFSWRLDNEVGGLIAHVGPCQCERWTLSNDGAARDCHMGSSLFWSCVAHLVSLHSSYSHRTPREGVRSLSGFMNTYGRLLLYDISIAKCPTPRRE